MIQANFICYLCKLIRVICFNNNLSCIQKGCLGLCGERVDSIDYYKQQVKELDKRVSFHKKLIRIHNFNHLSVNLVTIFPMWICVIIVMFRSTK